jgi:hypothetical protein
VLFASRADASPSRFFVHSSARFDAERVPVVIADDAVRVAVAVAHEELDVMSRPIAKDSRQRFRVDGRKGARVDASPSSSRGRHGVTARRDAT